MTDHNTGAQAMTALRRAAVKATRAPSVHNTQPWSLHLRRGELHIMADRSRQLKVLDPTSRQLTISCGCALMNARVSLAADGVAAEITRMPDPLRSDLLAIVRPSGDSGATFGPLAALDNVLDLRQTNRRHFEDSEVPVELQDLLERAATEEGGSVVFVHGQDQRLAVAALSQRADDIENLNPAYRAELRAWTTDDPSRLDGVPDLAVPHVDGGDEDEVPIRDFDTRGTGGLPTRTASSHTQCLALITTAGDSPLDWLRAGEAMERVLLEITQHGFVASPLTQVTEVPSARAALRQELSMSQYPHVLLRIGRAPLTPGARRRRLVDVLVESDH